MSAPSTLTVYKSSTDILPVFADWSGWLTREGTSLGTTVTISTSSWSIEGSGVTLLGSPAPAVSGSITSAWLDGGTSGTRAYAVNRITTSAGHDVSRSITVVIT